MAAMLQFPPEFWGPVPWYMKGNPTIFERKMNSDGGLRVQ